MAEAAVTYTNAKTAMIKAGLPTSEGTNWTNVDQASWNTFITQDLYAAGGYSTGPLQALYGANYGFAYAGEMPAGVTNLVGAMNYSATLAASEYTGAAPQTVTLTLTEENANGSEFLWTFGDGTTAVTTTPETTHDYTTAGTYTASVIPVVNSFKEPMVAIPEPIILT
jgi:PKD repeat protein